MWVCPACSPFPFCSQDPTSWRSPLSSCPSPTWILLPPKHIMPFWTSQLGSQRFSPPNSSPCGSSSLPPSPVLLALIQSWSPLLLPKPVAPGTLISSSPGVGVISLNPSTQGIAMVAYWSRASTSPKWRQSNYKPCPGEQFLPIPLDKSKDMHSLQCCRQPRFDYRLTPIQWLAMERERNHLRPR